VTSGYIRVTGDARVRASGTAVVEVHGDARVKASERAVVIRGTGSPVVTLWDQAVYVDQTGRTPKMKTAADTSLDT